MDRHAARHEIAGAMRVLDTGRAEGFPPAGAGGGRQGRDQGPSAAPALHNSPLRSVLGLLVCLEALSAPPEAGRH